MRQFFIASLFVAVGTIALAGGAVAQSAQGEGSGAVSASWTAPRTAWGHPSLEGIWSSGYIQTPLERPDKYNGREFLTDAEMKEEQAKMDASQDHSTGGKASTAARAGDTGAYNTVWSGRGREIIRTRRTSFVIDPPDGKIPWKPELREKMLKGMQMSRSGAGSRILEDNDLGGDGPEDRPNDRCRGYAIPAQYSHAESGGAHQRFVQSPSSVGIYYEYGPHGGAHRTVPIDSRPHLPPTVRLWLGDSVARWEGDTLVVDTTNFTDQTSYAGSRENMHLVERFTRKGPDFMLYQATIEDPTIFTRPWTIEVPFTKKDEKANQIFESACHEGNYGMIGILAGARALEKERAATKKPTK
jgi:hypothetical protein